MTESQIISTVNELLRELKTPYVFVVRQGTSIRTSFFPTPPVAGELFARAVSTDQNFGKVLTEAMKNLKFKPT